ncbi:MAG: hypothetical protein ABSA27_10370 [Terriglobales bacterium]
MNRIREILLTEYIGAILVALLIADAIMALVTLLAGQIYYHVFLARQYAAKIPIESQSHSILTALVRMMLYLASAYLIARWLYRSKPPVTQQDSGEAQPRSEEV